MIEMFAARPDANGACVLRLCANSTILTGSCRCIGIIEEDHIDRRDKHE